MSFECQAKQVFRKHFELSLRTIDINNQPKVRDEVTSVFISAMLGHTLKRWDGRPCIQNTYRTSIHNKKKHEEKHKAKDVEKLKSEELHSDTRIKITRKSKKSLQNSTIEAKDSPSRDHAEDENTLKGVDRNSTFSPKNIITNPYLVAELLSKPDSNEFINDWKFKEYDQLVHIKFKNENSYIGKLSRSVMHGQGEYQWKDGTIYKGTFNNGVITGRGRMQWPMQAWYEGDFFHGYRHGYGILVIPELLMYIGRWDHGKRHGKGLLIYCNDSPTKCLFEVNWVNGVANGKGFRAYPSGVQYDGEWVDGLPQGHGTMIWPNGDTYIGNWAKGEKEGIGKYIWCGALTNDFCAPARNSYFGMWQGGQRQGIGILDTINGAMVKGEWRNNLKMGYGVLVCKNGLQIEGDPLFSNDNMVLVPLPNNHTWHFMTLTDNCNILKHNYTLNKYDLNDNEYNSSQLSTSNNNIKKSNILETNDNYMISSSETKNIKFNPTLLPDEYIDLSYYINRLVKQKNVMEVIKYYDNGNRVTKMFEEYKTMGKRVTINRNTTPFHKYEMFDSTDPIPFFCFESKWVRNVILRHLPYLRRLFQEYCGMLCKEIPKFLLLMPRLLLWQLFRDCVRHKIILSEIDVYVNNNPTSLIEDLNNPFEKLKFFQFLHYLMELSWQLYGKYAVGLESTPGVLGSALEKLIEDDIKPNAGNFSGNILLLFPDLLPFHDLYNNLYCKYKIFTSRTILNIVLAVKPTSPFLYRHVEEKCVEKFIPPIQSNSIGKNIFGIGDRPVYEQVGVKSLINTEIDKVIMSLSQEEIDSEQLQSDINDLEKAMEVEKQISYITSVTDKSTEMKDNIVHSDQTVSESETPQIDNDDKDAIECVDISPYSLNNIDIDTAIKCITQVCPLTKCGSKIANMDAKITFLEVYEMLFLMSYKSLKIEENARHANLDKLTTEETETKKETNTEEEDLGNKKRPNGKKIRKSRNK